MNRLKIDLYIKSILVLIVTTITVVLNFSLLSEGVSFVSLYELYSVDSFSDLLFAVDLKYLLFFPLLTLVTHKEVTLEKLLLLIPVFALIVITQNIYIMLILTYIAFVVRRDSEAVKELFKWFGVIVVVMLGSKTLSLNVLSYLPILFLLFRKSGKNSNSFDTVALLLTVLLISKNGSVANVYTDLVFLILVSLYHIQKRSKELLLLCSFWLAFGNETTIWVVIPFVLFYLESLNIKHRTFQRYYSVIMLLVLTSITFLLKTNETSIYVVLLITLIKVKEHIYKEEGYFNV